MNMAGEFFIKFFAWMHMRGLKGEDFSLKFLLFASFDVN